jgi:hypothetical protein
MPIHCHECQERLLERTSERDVLPPEMRAHLDSCAACATFAVRAARLQRAFSDLSRHGVPAELDGRVVAACHAGHRQARAASHVAHLSRWNVPGELDRKVLESRVLDRSTAPDVLDRLVSEDLRDPSKAIARRFAGRLARLAAPPELRRRVERVFGARDATRTRRAPRVLQLAVAVFVVVLGGGLLWMRGKSERRYSFEVRRESVHASADPLLRGMLDGLSGGLLDTAQGGPR